MGHPLMKKSLMSGVDELQQHTIINRRMEKTSDLLPTVIMCPRSTAIGIWAPAVVLQIQIDSSATYKEN